MMRSKYCLYYTKEFERDLRKILKNKRGLARRAEFIIERIKEDPFAVSLRTHSVTVPSFGRVYSSRVNGDYRVIWTLEDEDVILLRRIGSHSGGSKVYK